MRWRTRSLGRVTPDTCPIGLDGSRWARGPETRRKLAGNLALDHPRVAGGLPLLSVFGVRHSITGALCPEANNVSKPPSWNMLRGCGLKARQYCDPDCFESGISALERCISCVVGHVTYCYSRGLACFHFLMGRTSVSALVNASCARVLCQGPRGERNRLSRASTDAYVSAS